MNVRAGWPRAPKLSVGSCVLHKTSMTLMHHGECLCVCVCALCKPPWKAPLLKSHVGLQTLQRCCLIVYSAISGSPFISAFKKAGNLREFVRRFALSQEGSGKLNVVVAFLVLFCAAFPVTRHMHPRVLREKRHQLSSFTHSSTKFQKYDYVERRFSDTQTLYKLCVNVFR